MKKVIVTLAALAFMATNAMAFSLGYEGPVYFKYSNWEQSSNHGAINAVGETLSGIGIVTGIYKDVSGAPQLLWNAATANEELTISFSGYKAADISTTGHTINFTGGEMNIYLDPSKNFNPAYGADYGAAATATATDGTLFLSTVGAPQSSGYTLTSFVTSFGPLFSGFGSGYLDVTGGSFAAYIGKNTYGPDMDLYVNSSLTAPDTTNGWPVSSQDPVRGNVVPEPGTFVLLGAGLLGLVGLKRRRS